jgi:hypothetical protein
MVAGLICGYVSSLAWLLFITCLAGQACHDVHQVIKSNTRLPSNPERCMWDKEGWQSLQ